MIGLILFSVFIGIPAILVGIAALTDKIQENQQEKNYTKQVYDEILNSQYYDNDAKIKGSIKDLPQLTFEKWLSFYNINPENWDMTKFSTVVCNNHNLNYLVPTYYKVKMRYDKQGRAREVLSVTGIPIFWSSPEEMDKFDNWFQNEYKNGKAKVYENRRDASLAQLAEFLQEDVAERRRQLQAEYDRVVDDVKVKVPDSNIELTLQQGSK